MPSGVHRGIKQRVHPVREDATRLKEVTLMHLEVMSPPARVANLLHCLLCYRAELWALHQMVHAASLHTEAARVLNTPWSPQPRQALALTHVVDMLLLYRRISFRRGDDDLRAEIHRAVLEVGRISTGQTPGVRRVPGPCGDPLAHTPCKGWKGGVKGQGR